MSDDELEAPGTKLLLFLLLYRLLAGPNCGSLPSAILGKVPEAKNRRPCRGRDLPLPSSITVLSFLKFHLFCSILNVHSFHLNCTTFSREVGMRCHDVWWQPCYCHRWMTWWELQGLAMAAPLLSLWFGANVSFICLSCAVASCPLGLWRRDPVIQRWFWATLATFDGDIVFPLGLLLSLGKVSLLSGFEVTSSLTFVLWLPLSCSSCDPLESASLLAKWMLESKIKYPLQACL